jgi:26S proteasome regulatory subunit T1
LSLHRSVERDWNQGVKESDTGLASPNLWDLAMDRQRMGEGHLLQVARCTKIIPVDSRAAEAARAVNPAGAVQGQKGADKQDKYQAIAKLVVGLGGELLQQILKRVCELGEFTTFFQ